MTATSSRRADCPPWCASDHTGTDESSRPVPHFAEQGYAADGAISVGAALLGGEEPEVILDRVLGPAETMAILGRPPAWVRLPPAQAANLAAILDTAGQRELAALIRQAAAVITGEG